MKLLGDILGQSIILLIIGVLFSFSVWGLKVNTKPFGYFLNKYGEIIAYGGMAFIAIALAFVQWINN